MAIDYNPIVLIKSNEEWDIYKSRWCRWHQRGGDPVRFPCLVTTVVLDGSATVRYIFAYEEILIAYSLAIKEKNKKELKETSNCQSATTGSSCMEWLWLQDLIGHD